VTDEWNLHPILPGEHVRLEPLTEEHAEGLSKAGADPDIWTWMTLRQPRDLTAMHDVVRDTLADGSRLAWAQIDTRTGEVAGTTSYYKIDPHHRIVSIGYTWIGRSWQRTALNTEAKFLLLRRAFDVLGAFRVSWETDVHNEPSQKAIERIGPKREGVLRAHRIRPDGTLRDTVVYSLTAPEWHDASKWVIERLAR
jgi:RimJ/RimL family protein N-acetyltransferase